MLVVNNIILKLSINIWFSINNLIMNTYIQVFFENNAYIISNELSSRICIGWLAKLLY